MKKQFFYAAMAIAFMASCTSEDNLVVDPVNPTPEEDKVALNLGVATPAMTVGSRGTGMVGYVGDYANKSSWDSQELFVSMVDKKTNLVYEEPDGTPYFNKVTFRAPKSVVDEDNNKGLIRIYNTYNEADDNGILEYKYYPVTGNYTFYGWHVDDAYDATAPTLTTTAHSDTDSNPETPDDGGTATVTGIIINGSQDVLAANTLAIPENMGSSLADNPYYTVAQEFEANGGTYGEMYAAQFSAKTARNGFTPILNFKHTLARLQFFVRSGKGSDAAKNYMKLDESDGQLKPKKRVNYQVTQDNWKESEDEDDNTKDDDFAQFEEKDMLDGAMYVTGIKLLNVYDNIELNLIDQTANVKSGSAKATNGFDLMSTPEQAELTNIKALQPLVAVAPEYVWGFNTIPEGGTEVVNNADGTMATPIGESIMYLPVAEQDIEGNEIGTDQIIKLQVQLGQCLIKTENESKLESDPDKYTYYWDQPKPVTLSLDASNLTVPNGPDNQPLSKEFAAGRSYNVYITIYGRERIEVSAQLVPWVEGGDITGDIEDDYVTE